MKQHAAHVRRVATRARGEWFRDKARALLEQELLLVRTAEAEWTAAEATGAAMHLGDAHECIAAELVACTLGQRWRPELRVDPVGKFLHAFRQISESLHRANQPAR